MKKPKTYITEQDLLALQTETRLVYGREWEPEEGATPALTYWNLWNKTSKIWTYAGLVYDGVTIKWKHGRCNLYIHDYKSGRLTLKCVAHNIRNIDVLRNRLITQLLATSNPYLIN